MYNTQISSANKVHTAVDNVMTTHGEFTMEFIVADATLQNVVQIYYDVPITMNVRSQEMKLDDECRVYPCLVPVSYRNTTVLE